MLIPGSDTPALAARQLHQQGRLDEANAQYNKALQAGSADSSLLRDHGVLLLQLGRHAEAEKALSSIAMDDALWAQAAAPLVVCLRSQGKIVQALETARQLTRHAPHQLQGQWLHACLLVQAGHYQEGVARLKSLLQHQPGHLEGQHFLGVGMQAIGNMPAAIQAYRQVAAHHPGAWYNIAQCAELAGDLPLAIQGYQHLASNPQPRADVLARLAHAQSQLGLLQQAAHTSSRLSQRLQQPAQLATDDTPEPFVCSARNLPVAQYRWVLERYAQRIRLSVRQPLPPVPAREGSRPWRIGYLSADFGSHAIGYLLDGLFQHHDRRNVQVFAYTLQSRPDAHEQALLTSADQAHCLAALDDHAAALKIRQDDIDVLIDLSGYTHRARPGIAAHRPARLQLGWLGFISPQQATWLDGLIFDSYMTVDTSQWPYHDRIVHLPGGMLPATLDPAPTPLPRADLGLDPADVLLLSCHAGYKLDIPVMQAWADIVAANPHARLLMIASHSSHAGLRASWKHVGGAPDQLHLLGNQPRATYLRLLACADLLLDAFAYGAGATAMDACQAGLPVLTLAGPNPWQRMAASLNHQLAMTELVCSTPAQYIQRGKALCRDASALQRVRRQLDSARQHGNVLDPRRSAQAMEHLCDHWLVHGNPA